MRVRVRVSECSHDRIHVERQGVRAVQEGETVRQRELCCCKDRPRSEANKEVLEGGGGGSVKVGEGMMHLDPWA